jgi:hypothetical protein
MARESVDTVLMPSIGIKKLGAVGGMKSSIKAKPSFPQPALVA